MDTILVTGADGFIGSHLTEMLVRDGYKVKAFVKYNSMGSWGWLDHCDSDIDGNFEVIAGDIRDSFAVNEAMKEANTVLHLAALIAIPYSYRSPESYVQTNIIGTLNVLQAARSRCLDRVVCTSTSETYGSAKFVPISEDHPLNAQSPYAATKIASDQMAIAFNKSFDLPVSILRPFNTYGPRQSARAVIPTIISQIANGSPQLKLGSLSPTRDFTFVSDTARGFIQDMQCSETIGTVTNIGSGFEISIQETIETIAQAMDVEVKVDLDANRVRPKNSEVDRLFADTTRAQKAFQWKPTFGGRTGFIKGLKLTAEWFKNPDNLKHYRTETYNV